MIKFELIRKPISDAPLFLMASKKTNWQQSGLSKKEADYIEKKSKENESFIIINQLNRLVCIQLTEEADKKKSAYERAEYMRNSGHKLCVALNAH